MLCFLLVWIYLFTVYCNAVMLFLETFEHCYTVFLSVVNIAAVPVFEGSKKCVTAVLVI